MFGILINQHKEIVENYIKPENKLNLKARGASLYHGITTTPVCVGYYAAAAITNFTAGLLDRDIKQLNNAAHAALIAPVLFTTQLALGILGMISPSCLQSTAVKLNKSLANHQFFKKTDKPDEPDNYTGWKRRAIFPVTGLMTGPIVIIAAAAAFLHSPLDKDSPRERLAAVKMLKIGFKMPFQGIREMIRPSQPQKQNQTA